MTEKKLWHGLVCCSAARTPQQPQTQRSPAQQAVTSPYDVNELLSCFLLLPPSQRSRCQAKCRQWYQASAEDGWSIFFPKNGLVSNGTSFAQIFPGSRHSNQQQTFAQSWAERNKSQSYVKSNNITHSEHVTSHHDYKFTVIQKTSNWQFSLHAYDEMVSITRNWRTNSAAIFHRCNPFCCNKIYPSPSENVADDIFHPFTWDNHAKSTSKSESLKTIHMRTDCSPRDNNGHSGG